MFDPTIGRWLEEDPIDFAGGDANLYRMAGNDPVNATDRNGLLPPDPPFPINKAEWKLEQAILEQKWKDTEQAFIAWYHAEKQDMSWLKELPIPPDR